MLRFASAVLAGYLAMAALVMAGFAALLAAPSFAFQEHTLNLNLSFLLYVLSVSFVAAVLGGFTTARIGRKLAPVFVLAGLVFLFGMLEASWNLKRPQPNFSADEVDAMTRREKMEKGVQPVAYSFALPLLGAGGIAVGAWLGGRRRSEAPRSVRTTTNE